MVIRPKPTPDTAPPPETGTGAHGTGASGTAQSPAPEEERGAAWRHQHLLDVDVLTRDEITLVLDTTEAMQEVLQRRVPRTPALRGVTVMNLFYESSTRTRASFELAGKVLGADVINLSAAGSSADKGESLLDTVRTLEAIGAAVLVIRHGAAGAPALAAQHTGAHVINAGDGRHAHPTQALLDAYTLRKALGTLEGKRIVIVGDIQHSRVARSNLWALHTLGAHVTLVAPRTLLPPALNASHQLALPAAEVDHDLDRAIQGADAIMALRIQRERMDGALLPSMREYARRYQITRERLATAAAEAPVLHPGPMNEGIEIAPDVAHGLQSHVERQVQHGVAVRMAVLYLLARNQT